MRYHFPFLVLSPSAGIKDEATALSVKAAYSALCAFIIEAVRGDTPTSSLQSSLDDAGFSSSAINTFLSLYSQHKQDILDVLNVTAFKLPKIVGLDWRLDYKICSSGTGTDLLPQYFITIEVEEPNGTHRNIEFSASWTELQDLLWRVRDASKQVERIVGASK